ncbi:MARTX multifunctional-autoprocessing repeats-in-toxin holotoxin RtxA [Xenorhabdus budapestensis]|uniref:MARTX multifunctional-autoprocessing repeats-in-toxin holotoxin RtxA n=1 Tax=Xenorhabdus budapestensis TaxID=290110 RepID=A0ABX7VDV8_XENBU|nr:MARTX multifunctional-autoprocessing repeats-in-toxin holotoxin RtxA [Xenorhabdus budapestensis]QTL38893.1 MARTX multifunctional-autoprocessing repeats-in-toxin holotoxin RtxA [Xenorhabdus budapestensis]
MGKPFWRSVEYFFTGNYSADDGDNNIVAIGFGGQIQAYGGNDHITLGSIGAVVYTGSGHDTVVGGAAYLKVNDTTGNLNVKGAAGYAEINKEKEGTITFSGATGGAAIQHNGHSGNVHYSGIAAYNDLYRRGNSGDITFKGLGGYNHLYSDVTHGNIHFIGGGGYNQITRKGLADCFSGEGIVYAKAEEIVLTTAMMGGSWIEESQKVIGVKSTRDINTYLFAFADEQYTKVNKIHLYNDPRTGRLKYYTTSWYKKGNHLKNLASQDISDYGGYQVVDVDGAYTLSNLTVEQHQSFTVHALESELPENEWVTYGGGVQIAAENITLSDAQMGGYAVSTDGSTVAVKPVKSNRMENTYLYAQVFGGYTKVVVVQLANDPKTGELKYIATSWYKAGDQTAALADQFIGIHSGYKVIGKGSYTLSNVHYSVNTVRVTSERIANMHEFCEQELLPKKQDDSHGDVRFEGAGGGNVIKSNVARGNVYFKGAGLANVILHNSEIGDTEFDGGGAANVIFKKGRKGQLHFNGGGLANVITHISMSPATALQEPHSSQTKVVALGGANILTRKGDGKVFAIMGGGANVLNHIGQGVTTSVMMGGANILTKVGDGETTGIMFGLGNVLTHVGNGRTLGAMGAAGNVFTKVGNGETIAAMLAVGNIFTHVGQGDAYAIMAGGGNIFTKVGNGHALALMVALGNVFTHVGDGLSVALMVAKGNMATKVGNGETLVAMIGVGNIMTHIGDGNTFAAMLGEANVLTKAGHELTAALMIGKANIYTHVGNGTSIGLFVGEANIMTKVGDGTTLAAMFGQANIMTHVGQGMTGVLALGEANVVTKVGHNFLGVVAAAKANVITHVGQGTTAGLLLGKGNILTKVGTGTTAGLLVSQFGNIMTHVGDGNTVGFAKGNLNLMTKVGDGLVVNAAWGDANIMTHVGRGDHYNFAKGKANIVTKIGDGQTVNIVQGTANIITHVGKGNDYTGAWGKANVITKVGQGRQVTLAKGDANIVTQVGQGDSFNALWSQSNIVTKVGDGMLVTAAKGKSNITTNVGNGLSVVATHGDLNVNTKVGDGVSVSVAWGKFNINTKVGDGLNLSVMKGTGNANIHVGDGMNIHASYARNNVAIQVGNGDFYHLALASGNTERHKLEILFSELKQTLLGVMGSQGINFLVHGDEANTSGSYRGRGAINLPEVNALKGFELTEMAEVRSDLATDLRASVNQLNTPDISKLKSIMNADEQSPKIRKPNLIANGDFEARELGWGFTEGIEALHPAEAYGLGNYEHGKYVTELDTYVNTTIYQDLRQLQAGEVITLDFDFAKRSDSTNDNGMEVLWNDQVVFSSSGDESTWQHKQLVLVAQAGSNRLAFKGTGNSDSKGYILDNVVATSDRSDSRGNAESPSGNLVSGRVLSDKANAEADRERLKQEKEKQLAAIADTQSQLAATDLYALNTNGLSQLSAIKEEEQTVTDELLAKVIALESLNNQTYTSHQGESGAQWRQDFAGGLLGNLQIQLDSVKETAGRQLDNALSTIPKQQDQIEAALNKSEVNVAKSKQDQLNAQKDVVDAQAKAAYRKEEALTQQKQAEQATRNSYQALQEIEAEVGTAAKDNAHKPNFTNAGSGRSGKAYEAEGAGNTASHIGSGSLIQGVGAFSQKLQESDNDLSALADAKQAVERLQINAGLRAGHTNTIYVPRSLHTPQSSHQSNNGNASSVGVLESITNVSGSENRKEQPISGLDLSGLKALGRTDPHSSSTSQVLHSSQSSLRSGATYPFIAARAAKVADIYRWLSKNNDRSGELSQDNYIPVPGGERVDIEINDNIRYELTNVIENFFSVIRHTIPNDQIAPLAKLFVDSTIDFDWDKRVQFMTKLERFGYSFEPPHGEKSIVSFWSGPEFSAYRHVLDAAQKDGKKVVYDIDVKGNVLALELNQKLKDWSNISLDPDDFKQQNLHSAINEAVRSNIGFWSSIYATGARDDIYVIVPGGLRLKNFFWNVELPVLRQLQREGLVNEIRLLDKPVYHYRDKPLESIGRRLTDAGVRVKIRFDSLSAAEKKSYLEQDPDGYHANSLIDLDIKLSAIDRMLNQAIPFYRLRTERNILIREGLHNSFEVLPWAETRSALFKTIKVDNPKDPAQMKTIEHFIFANYQNYEQLPAELRLVENHIISLEEGHTRILAERADGVWYYLPDIKLMSGDELQKKAYVKGKPLGESYRKVIEALRAYEQVLLEKPDYSLDAIEKLTDLHQQVEGYLLGHSESGRAPAMKLLLSQINTRLTASLVLAEPTLRSSGQGNFSELYIKLDNANLKDSKHLYLDAQGDFVTRGQFSLHISRNTAGAGLQQVMAAVTKEYGQDVTNAVFSKLSARDLAKDGRGIDIAGLKKIHLAIEQHLSPVSATLYVWRPSEYSTLGHVALQIGQGRVLVNADDAKHLNEINYVSWWPAGNKFVDIRGMFDISTQDQPDLRLRWYDLSQPAFQAPTLTFDVEAEEDDDFGLVDGSAELREFIEKLRIAKGVDAKFKDVSEIFAMAALANPELLKSAEIPEYIYRPFLAQWDDPSIDMHEVGRNFAETLRMVAQMQTPKRMESAIADVMHQFAERELVEITDFKNSKTEPDRVYRINLEGLDVAAMQAEWGKISSDPDARYQLLTKNCSSVVARILRAGGAEKMLGKAWRPAFGVWTPSDLFNFGRSLQQAVHIERVKQKHLRLNGEPFEAILNNETNEYELERVAILNDGSLPREREPLNPLTRFMNNELYGVKEERRRISQEVQNKLNLAVNQGVAQKVTLRGEIGRLDGYYYRVQSNRAQSSSHTSMTNKVVLFIHGSGASAEEQTSKIQPHYQQQGIDMLSVNMRGYGTSDGYPGESGMYQDVRTMFRYLVNDRGIKPENIIIHGYSMGAPIAADLARYADRQGMAVSGLLLDRPMPSMSKAITAHEIPNPSGLTGILAKAVNGKFSVEQNLRGISKQTPIMLLTDNEGLGNEGEKLRTRLMTADYNISGERTYHGHESSYQLMSQYADKIVSHLSGTDQQAQENTYLKGIKSDFRRYMQALKPQVDEVGIEHDIRATKVFLSGYKHNHAERIVDGFHSDMDIKQLVDLLVKGNWTAEQKGALAWEIENRALKITLRPKTEKYSQLFRDITATGAVDPKASEHLAPQLLLLNLSNDGFGGRCVPLSKLVLLAKQLENDGQENVGHDLLNKLYSAASVLSHPELYSEVEQANASKLLGTLSALYARDPMLDSTFKIWKEKLSGEKALTVKGMIEKITATSVDGQPILLELDTLGHAMAAWSKGSGENRMYGFYDPNVGIVEFSSVDKFSKYVTRFFGRSDLDMSESYKMSKNGRRERVFERVIVLDGQALAPYRPVIGDIKTMKDILAMEIFDGSPMKNALERLRPLNNHDVNAWEVVDVFPRLERKKMRFDGQVIIQLEDDPIVADSVSYLTGKHPKESVLVQLDTNGQYKVIYGDPSLLNGKIRWQVVGHGGDDIDGFNHTTLSDYTASELAMRLKQFKNSFQYGGELDHISLVGCSLLSDDKRDGFAYRLISALDENGIRTTVSARRTEVVIGKSGRKYTKSEHNTLENKIFDNKIVLNWNEQGELEGHSERIRNNVSENDVSLVRVGSLRTDSRKNRARGAITDNTEVFHAPEKYQYEDYPVGMTSDNRLSYSGNVQIQAGDGEFTSINWGTTNVGIKVGTGGFKSLAFGDNNVMVHLGNGDSKHSVNIAGYQALEGAQLFIGNRNISFNQGRSNDLLVMMDKSIPTPPMLNPFDSVSRVSGSLQNIAGTFSAPDWLSEQEAQWTVGSVKKYLQDMSGLDMTSSVDYTSLTEIDSQYKRSGRGLKNDIENTLNKKYNQWLSGAGNKPKPGNLSRADKLRQVNEKLSFNFAVGGQGADIQVTTGNWNFMFGDNIQSILDINLGSLFGLMTQQYTSTGMAKTTFTFSPTDLPRQLKNKLLRNLASVNADTTLADIFNVDYTSDGAIVSRSNQPVDGVAILREMLEVISEFSGSQLEAFIDPETLRSGLKTNLSAGADGLNSFLESHGIKEKAPTEQTEPTESVGAVPTAEDAHSERTFGFNSLNLPNLFETLFSQDKQREMKELVSNLKQNLTDDLLHMKEKTFDFLRNSGHLQGDGDIHVSLGNYNFNWGGDGKDLGAYLGDNNNFWGGRGDDVYYALGTSNIFTGGEGNDMGVLMGRENIMFGGKGNDVAVVAGRINYAYMGDGDDQVFAFGEGAVIETGRGRDYIVASGHFNRIESGEGQDYVVAIGNNNQVELGDEHDFATVFGNYNQIDAGVGNDTIKLMGYHALINGGAGDDHLIADVISKFSQFDGGDGDDLLVLGGYQNNFKGGAGVNSYVVNGDVIDNVVEDIKRGDKIVFDNLNWQNLWFQRSGYDLVMLTNRNIEGTSEQGQFEAIGSVTFTGYFNGNRADIITQMSSKDARGEREYTALSANALDSLVQAMSGFAPAIGDSGFIDSLDRQTQSSIMMAWSDTITGKSKLA